MSETESRPFYITTTLPYVNATPHVGFAMEVVRADAVARYKKQQGCDVFFNTGTDEHGVKIYEKAEEAGVDPQAYVDNVAQAFKDLLPVLSISDDVRFTRTTDTHHEQAAQAFWRRCYGNGDIYKGTYAVKYCVGCELEKTESDLDENGRCPDHATRELEIREEENYFFRFTAYADKLLELYEKHPDFVAPEYRLNELKRLIEGGLQDFSISRLREKMPWGIDVPDDPDHVMYVWFDALVNYISVLGWPEDAKTPFGTGEEEGDFERFWVHGTPTQYAGKDNLRQQAAMWQAMLMSAGLPNSDRVIINGFITSNGQKMSKSSGNVVDPVELVNEYGTDAVRFYLLREVHPFDDSDITPERFRDGYNASLANGLGNLVSRILKMKTSYAVDVDVPKRDEIIADPGEEYQKGFENFEINRAAVSIWERISKLDQHITETEPFKTIKTDEAKAKQDVTYLVQELYRVAVLLEPLMPETAERIQTSIESSELLEQPLFPRK